MLIPAINLFTHCFLNCSHCYKLCKNQLLSQLNIKMLEPSDYQERVMPYLMRASGVFFITLGRSNVKLLLGEALLA